MRTIAATVSMLLAMVLLAGTSAAETLLARGTYLMESVAACPVCHTPWDEDGQRADLHFAGGMVFEEEWYTAYASNITPDPETGIGGWSDAQIIAAVREGRRPDGSLIGPAMPIALYRGISDRDSQAIVAYLRSIPPIGNEVPASEYDIPLPADYGPPLGAVPEVAYYDLAAYGEYLAGPIANCIDCHTPLVDGWRDYENGLGAGGHEMQGPWGETTARNITPDWGTGLGRWNSRKMRTAITRGLRPDGDALGPPMPYARYATMDRQDLSAILAYVRSLPQIENDTD